ncbi:cellulase family glycosylhydrolase [Hymenobacter sp. BT186]|uniref:Cellulase family glycosylhydrolase n=1 Tax=Hymenobacter telluris TaxID=2816474 RepID=A0A939EYP3_9BACT|nr:cellulase family glycosylhydrolase [Hymenobacter telluris]MBO0359611.1 cellulase family glycosylhydrolase [Hymenobacter telluris]MBW3375638.1 cellulase family glycosylhydrolase [Hymenobacter norwichensis]
MKRATIGFPVQRRTLMGIVLCVGLLLGLLTGSRPVVAQQLSMLHAAGSKILDANGREVVLRGYNVGGWLLQESYILQTDTLDCQWRIKQGLLRTMSEAQMEEFYRQYRANFITKADIDYLAKLGFNCVRVPFHYDLFLTDAQRRARTQVMRSPQNVAGYVQNLSKWYDENQLFTDKNMEGFRQLDNVLNWCAANNLYVILDLHAAPGGQGADRNINDNFVPLDLWKRRDAKGRLIYQDVTVRLWEKLAARYRSDARIALYDLINEPHKMDAANGLSGDNRELSALYARLINAVRAQHDQHILLLEGNGYGNEYTNLTPDKLAVRDKSNLAYNAHRYWCPNDPTATDPNPNQINLLHNLVAFRERWQVPVWVGETGENSNEWFAAAVQGLNAQNIGWCHWNIKRVNSAAGLLRIKSYGSLLTAEGRAALLRNVQFSNCIPNRDVATALTQTSSFSAPFLPHAIPGTIQAADYDLGRAEVAYHDAFSAKTDYRDNTPWNQGGAYRNDGVDINTSPDGTFAVSHLTTGEWLNYTVTVSKPGAYDVQVRVQSTAPGRLTLKMEEATIATLPVSQGTSPEQWQTLTLQTQPLPAGQHTLRLCVEQPVTQLAWLRFTPAAVVAPGG